MLVVLLTSSLSCERSVRESLVDVPSPPILEIKHKYYGAVSYKGDFLVIRLDSSGSTEKDCLRDYEEPLSESNIFRVKTAQSLNEFSKIQQLIDAAIVDAKSQYFNRTELTVDSSSSTYFVMKGTDGTEKTIDIDGGYSRKMEKEPDFPHSLHELFDTVISVYGRICSQNR